MGVAVTEGLGAGSQPEVGRAAAEEAIDEIKDHLAGSHMVFVTAGMGGGTGTGAAPIIARLAREHGILTVGVVTKPFQFEGVRRMRVADSGIKELEQCVDTLIVIPNQNLFRIANEKTTFADAFAMADQVLYSGVACITDLMVKEGLINLDFADVRSVMREMGKAMMGTGEASGERRATEAAEAAIANPLLDETSMRGARGLLISITGGKDLTLFEVDEAATRIREEVDPDANIILGATFEEALEGVIRVSVVATGIDSEAKAEPSAGSAAPTIATSPSACAPPPPPRAAVRSRTAAAAPRRCRPARPAARSRSPQPRCVQPAAADGAARAPRPWRRPLDRLRPRPRRLRRAPRRRTASDDAARRGAVHPAGGRSRRRAFRASRISRRSPSARSRRTATTASEHADRGPMGLLRRLASASLGRREEAAERRRARQRVRPRPQRPASSRRSRAPPGRPASGGRSAAYRAAQGDLDPHGRRCRASARIARRMTSWKSPRSCAVRRTDATMQSKPEMRAGVQGRTPARNRLLSSRIDYLPCG